MERRAAPINLILRKVIAPAAGQPPPHQHGGEPNGSKSEPHGSFIVPAVSQPPPRRRPRAHHAAEYEDEQEGVHDYHRAAFVRQRGDRVRLSPTRVAESAV